MLVEPFIRVGNLYFNDTKEQIRGKLNQKFEEGIKEFDSIKEYYDYFPALELFVYYNTNDNVNAFEFFKSNPVFNSLDLLTMTYSELVVVFSNLDPDLENGYNDFTSNKFGIGGNASDDPEDENSLPEAIIIFRKDYYDLVNS